MMALMVLPDMMVCLEPRVSEDREDKMAPMAMTDYQVKNTINTG